jgi:hypothetical protein
VDTVHSLAAAAAREEEGMQTKYDGFAANPMTSGGTNPAHILSLARVLMSDPRLRLATGASVLDIPWFDEEQCDSSEEEEMDETDSW